MHSLQKFCCGVKVEPGLIILDYRRINFRSLGKIYISKMKYSSYNPEYSFL